MAGHLASKRATCRPRGNKCFDRVAPQGAGHTEVVMFSVVLYSAVLRDVSRRMVRREVLSLLAAWRGRVSVGMLVYSHIVIRLVSMLWHAIPGAATMANDGSYNMTQCIVK